MATGAATFTIKKTNQNVIDTAVVGSTTLITTGHSGGLTHTDQNGMVYSSVNDASSTAVIEKSELRRWRMAFLSARSHRLCRVPNYAASTL